MVLRAWRLAVGVFVFACTYVSTPFLWGARMNPMQSAGFDVVVNWVGGGQEAIFLFCHKRQVEVFGHR